MMGGMVDHLADSARARVLAGLENSLGTVLENLMEEVYAERGCLVFFDEHYIYRGKEELREVFPFSSSVVEHLLEDGIGLVSFNSDDDDAGSSVKIYGLRSAVAAAIECDREGLLGILYCDNQCSPDAFTESDLEKLKSVARAVGPAVSLHTQLRHTA